MATRAAHSRGPSPRSESCRSCRCNSRAFCASQLCWRAVITREPRHRTPCLAPVPTLCARAQLPHVRAQGKSTRRCCRAGVPFTHARVPQDQTTGEPLFETISITLVRRRRSARPVCRPPPRARRRSVTTALKRTTPSSALISWPRCPDGSPAARWRSSSASIPTHHHDTP